MKTKPMPLTKASMVDAQENPYAVWNDVAAQTSEMMTASAQVISHRTTRMALAGPMPNQRDKDEFSLMGQEKIDALTESTYAITMRLMGLQQQVAKLALQELLNGTKGLLALAAGTFLKPISSGRNQMIYRQITRSAKALSQINASLADVAQTGLHPLHSRATANAKRLGKLKPA
ncbi:polyhydroxyalkanoate granule-associated phasin [Glaciimonas immobilis]|uniref:Phasin domain-containing protein n=1 Tax=Glaciimonas immobilis TaxID=728004 RepID=A0A840RJ73_9BURK|nr:polyhydroxyalkanoate granule-associated phasin [Glaciimonas immobilis]KAF3998845.1 hypothetical protein HAV38_02440 [Glaciimonas immobilis]MBB5198237.1 hypothetical protein [Glaciimonas immobilis]